MAHGDVMKMAMLSLKYMKIDFKSEDFSSLFLLKDLTSDRMCVIIIVSRGKGNKIKNKNKIKNLLTNELSSSIIKTVKEREENKMTVNEMMDNVIRQLGFESPLTVMFCKDCESGKFTNEELMRLMHAIVEY